MIIDPLGELTRDPDIDEWLQSEKVDVGYFPGVKLRFVLESVEDDASAEEFAAAISNFLALTMRHRDEATPFVFANYREFVEAIEEDEWNFTLEDIWSHVHPTAFHVSRGHHDGKVYVQITAECDWEVEHGLQLIYREGIELTRVSDQDGHLTNGDA